MAIDDELKTEMQKNMTISSKINLWDKEVINRHGCMKFNWYVMQVFIFLYECFFFYFFGLIGYVYAYHRLFYDTDFVGN